MTRMVQITDNQRRILEILDREYAWWAQAMNLSRMIEGMTPHGAGMALKGLWKRGLVDRRSPTPKASAAYRINSEGSREVQKWAMLSE
jgi:hypothetical protein